jgi:quinol monooxygenase YgiN
MYARSTTITADPMRMDDGIADVRDNVMPAVLDMDGCIGLSMLCDRDSGRCIVTTAWADEAAMAASRDRVRAMRDRTTDILGGDRPEIQEWEVAAMHRLHPADEDACARVTWTRADPAYMERTVDAFRMAMIPRMDDVPGFCSLSLMIDRQTGLGSLTAVYTDRRAMDASRDHVMDMRQDFSRQMDMEVTMVEELDLALHHLRIPEMA